MYLHCEGLSEIPSESARARSGSMKGHMHSNCCIYFTKVYLHCEGLSAESGFLMLIFLLFRHKISEFRINCFKFTQYFAKISRLIFIIIL